MGQLVHGPSRTVFYGKGVRPALDMDLPVERVHWKIQTWNRDPQNARALYVPYFDARDHAEKLDDLFGWDGWEDLYSIFEVKEYAVVVCELRVHTGTPENPWVIKSGTSEITGAGDTAVKGGESDAFKRACMKLGVGRNAYRLPTIWASCVVRGEGDRARPVMPDGHDARLTAQAMKMMAGRDPDPGMDAGAPFE